MEDRFDILKDFLKSIRKVESRKISHTDFNKIAVVGGGEFGKVWRGVQKSDGQVVAVKEINIEQITKKNHQAFLECEVYLSGVLFHPHIVTSIGHYTHKGNVNIVQELCQRGSLFDYIKNSGRLPEAEASKVIHEMASALTEFHSRGFLHGDLKPENILITDGGQTILGGYGLAWPLSLTSIRGKVGTIEYFAPEMFKDADYDEKIDSWALGILCYELLVGKLPFPDRSEASIRRYVSEANIIVPPEIELSQEAKDFMDGVLQKEPHSRFSMKDAIFHDWILKWHHTWV